MREFIEKKGYDIKGCDYDGRTALHLACEEGHLAVVKYLVSAGADINSEDRWGSTPIRSSLTSHNRRISLSPPPFFYTVYFIVNFTVYFIFYIIVYVIVYFIAYFTAYFIYCSIFYSFKDVFSFLKERGAVMGFSSKLVPGVAALKIAEKV